MALSQRIGGRYEVRGLQRQTRVGAWHVLSDQDGQPRGGLLLNEVSQAESQRLDSVLGATADLPGLLKVIARHGLWLITAQPAAPTLAQTLAARVALPEPVALAIAVDVAETLAALHASQTAHGALDLNSVILGVDGHALLAECGYAHALAGTKPGPGHDVTAWVRLLRDLAAPRHADTARQLLLRAADTAEHTGGSAGLAEALAVLSSNAGQVNGFGERSALAMLAALVPQPPTHPSAVEDVVETVPVGQSSGTGDNAVTVPVPPNRTVRMPDIAQQETLQPAQLALQQQRQKEDVLRYGRGVASLPQPRQAESTPGWVEEPYTRPKRPNPWRRRIFGAISTVVTLVLLAVVAFWLIERLRPLQISSATVSLAQDPSNQCDVKVHVIGTIKTNGAAGTVTYRWLTSDGRTQGPLSVAFNLGETEQNVPMFWDFKGRGTFEAKATLEILTPAHLEASKEFTYSCR
ncbi:hypothetical protein [Allorhizocola rhizosphaerae]|uniref:hypothetical protein n=1 Tax=Allorhizocola rhizosphaerae TaxID=1872709 RepID=UPI000E3BEAD2|nr:hypothetical protein [Allorhizocola rhizosphaerae]